MAKRNPYGKRTTLTGRQMVMAIILIMAVGAAVWRITVPPAEAAEDQNPGESSNGAPAKIQVTPPQNKPQQQASTAIGNQESSPSTNTKPSPAVQTPIVQPVKSQAQALLESGLGSLAAKDYIVASVKLTKAITSGLDNENDAIARKAINEASNVWLFSRNLYKGDKYSSRYEVVPGDRLVRIAKKYNVPHKFIMRINRIRNASALQAGQMLKVVNGPFHVKVDRGRAVMSVYLGDMIIRSYQVSTGKAGMETPLGFWQIQSGKKQVNPAWVDPDTGKKFWPDDKDNPLGERWIGMKGTKGDTVGRNGFGIHGTIEPEKIGTPASHGCIRLLNKDVEEVYDMLVEVKSTVLTFE